MSLSCDLSAVRGDFRIAARFVSPGRVVAVEGPSGAGKSTLLHALAGLIPVERAVFAIDGAPVVDTSAGLTPTPALRRLGYVFQDARLFPHLTVAGNIAFGSRFAAQSVALEPILDLLGLTRLMGRWPRTLSGGETRRVAVARALASAPRMLLLDEPFAGLDAGRRAELIPHLIRLKAETALPMLLVSHDPRDAEALADDRVTMIDGRIG